MPNTSLILHVKGTVDETTSLPTQAVRAAIAEGRLSRSQLIWSPIHNEWKQVRELPHLLPSQKLAPAPVPRAASGKLPRIASGALPRVATGALPRVATGALPRVVSSSPPGEKTSVGKSATGAGTQPAARNYKVVEKQGMPILKWLCLGLAVFILGIVGVNYLAVERPLVSALDRTPYSQVTVYAHFGGFVQGNTMEIHILGSSSLNEANLADFLVALAHSTPQDTKVFARISLTSGWFGQYSLSGSDWKMLGDMGRAGAAQQKEFLLNRLGDASGHLLLNSATTEEREKVWAALAARMLRS
jgi:hypothetical protein